MSFLWGESDQDVMKYLGIPAELRGGIFIGSATSSPCAPDSINGEPRGVVQGDLVGLYWGVL